MANWYILVSFGTFFPVLLCCNKKNLATLHVAPSRAEKKLLNYLETNLPIWDFVRDPPDFASCPAQKNLP
jgi:hypothetical protein